ELVPQLLKDMNLKLEGSKEDGFFNFLWQSLQDSDVRASSMVSGGGNGTGNNSQEAKGFTPVTPFGGETGLGVPPRPMEAPPVTPVEPPQGDGGLPQEGMTRIEGQAPSPTEIDFI